MKTIFHFSMGMIFLATLIYFSDRETFSSEEFKMLEQTFKDKHMYVCVNKELGFIWQREIGYIPYNKRTALRAWTHQGGNPDFLPYEFELGYGGGETTFFREAK